VERELQRRRKELEEGTTTKLQQGGKPKVWGPGTAHNARSSAFRVFAWAKEEGLLPENPLAGMKRPKPAPRQRAMTDDEFQKLYENAGGPFADFLLALRETGARPKEVRDLRWECVRAVRWVLAQHKTAKKTKKARVIIITDAVKAMMERLKGNGHTHVFLNREGQPWTLNAVRLQMKGLLRRLGVGRRPVCLLVPARVRHAGHPQRGEPGGGGRVDGPHLAGDGGQGGRAPGRPARTPEGRGGADQPHATAAAQAASAFSASSSNARHSGFSSGNASSHFSILPTASG
jgi:hypothetical protein